MTDDELRELLDIYKTGRVSINEICMCLGAGLTAAETVIALTLSLYAGLPIAEILETRNK